ncbi:MAG: IclR family transcriptional regulator [Halomonas sp.]|nr:IclR family transcriptional regulator [Halomonas sp.]TVP46364.1 MAG: IclR family transcriptional regulator [Halomonas sp.]
MAGSLIERTLGVLEILAEEAEGVPLQQLADQLAIPKSAAHRICNELIRLGHVRQHAASQHYQLTTRLVSLGLRYMSSIGTQDVVQPILDRLAEESRELVRLAVAEHQQLAWIAKAQGSRSGLRYDPDMGRVAPLASTATGHAWLACFSDAQALVQVERQQTNTLLSMSDKAALCAQLALTRQRGFSTIQDSMGPGTAAMATALRDRHGTPLGVLSIAGPSVRLTAERIDILAPALLGAAHELASVAPSSPLFS